VVDAGKENGSGESMMRRIARLFVGGNMHGDVEPVQDATV